MNFKKIRWDKIEKDSQINHHDIYIFSLGYWNNQITKYILKNDIQEGNYYILDPIPINNKIFFIDNDGNIKQIDNNFENYSYFQWERTNFFLFKTK